VRFWLGSEYGVVERMMEEEDGRVVRRVLITKLMPNLA
jgi:hypothetical protein